MRGGGRRPPAQAAGGATAATNLAACLQGGFKSSRFASEEEVLQITGCVPGAVPPFGSVWGLKTYMDESLKAQGDSINFNAGLRTHSVRMSVVDYIAVEEPTVCKFS